MNPHTGERLAYKAEYRHHWLGMDGLGTAAGARGLRIPYSACGAPNRSGRG